MQFKLEASGTVMELWRTLRRFQLECNICIARFIRSIYGLINIIMGQGYPNLRSQNIIAEEWGLRYRMVVTLWHNFDACGKPVSLGGAGYFAGYETSPNAT
jgi:hypothetical protein